MTLTSALLTGISMTVCSSGKTVGLQHALQVTIHPEVDGVKMDGRRCTPRQPEGEGCAAVELINDGGREPGKVIPQSKNNHTFISYTESIYYK